MSVRKVLLIRHGQTDFNRQRRLQGIMPVPLNQQGREQAAALAQHLRRQPIDAVFSSPLTRAKQTAQIIGQALKQPVQDDARLGEIDFGKFEGLTYSGVKARYPQAHRRWHSGYMPYRVPDGESRRDVQERMAAAFSDITALPGLAAVAVVTHGSALKIWLASMYAHLPPAPLVNTSITTLESWGDIWEMTDYAATPHLPDEAESHQ